LEPARRKAVRWRSAKAKGEVREEEAKGAAERFGDRGSARVRLRSFGEWLTRAFFWVGYLFTLLLAWTRPWALFMPPLLVLAWWWEGRKKIDRQAGLLAGAVFVGLLSATLFQETMAAMVLEDQGAVGVALFSGLALILAVASGRLLLALAAVRGGRIAWYAEASLLLAPVVLGLLLVLFAPLLYPSLFREPEGRKEAVKENEAS
jgi:preprotein translocase subunit SecG